VAEVAEIPRGDAQVPRVPAHLGPRGKRLWKGVHEDFEVGTAERELLIEACRSADELDRLQEVIRDAKLIQPGSMGQPAAHPLLRELSQLRHVYVRLLAQLGFEAAENEWDGLSASARARKAATERWRRGA